jgi:hypothetical protein
MEKDVKFSKKVNRLGSSLFDRDGKLSLNEDDIKMGTKLELIENLGCGS